MKKVPFYKKKWFVGTKIQIDLIIYIICMCFLSQMLVITNQFAEENLISAPYAQYLIIITQIAFYGCILYGLRLTNCIAGPLFRLQRHMDDMIEGKIDSKIQFRKTDYNSDLAESFNALIEQRIQAKKNEK